MTLNSAQFFKFRPSSHGRNAALQLALREAGGARSQSRFTPAATRLDYRVWIAIHTRVFQRGEKGARDFAGGARARKPPSPSARGPNGPSRLSIDLYRVQSSNVKLCSVRNKATTRHSTISINAYQRMKKRLDNAVVRTRKRLALPPARAPTS